MKYPCLLKTYQLKNVALINFAKKESTGAFITLEKRDIANIVERSKSTIQSAVDKIKKTGSSLLTKPKYRTYKINESQKLLTRAIGDNPFVIYDRLKLERHNVDLEICGQTVISSLKRMDYSSYFAAQTPSLTKEHMKKMLFQAQGHVN